ncbi:MAG: class I SAM-dependent methyltransferase [Anaerolineae bacterium]|nr:class I SAM-dependent methyltransferase [Anaerolineae bacterium]
MSDSDSKRKEVFERGAAYEPYVGRWSRRVAPEFLAWLSIEPGKRWLDVGSGTGALSQTILRMCEPLSVTGIDRSEGFVAYASEQVQDARVEFRVGDAQDLPVETGTFDAAVSGLMLNFVPQPQRAVDEMARALKPGGTAALYVWDYAGMMQFMRIFWDAAAELDPKAGELDQGSRFTLCNPDGLTGLFHAANLSRIEVRAIDIPTVFQNFDDYWTPFLGGQGSAPTYVASLKEEQRDALRGHLKNRLPLAPDGSIPLVARAWAVRGRRLSDNS